MPATPKRTEAEAQAMSSFTLSLPWPPSVNSYWRQARGRMVLSREAREFTERCAGIIAHRKLSIGRSMSDVLFPDGRLALTGVFHPPDRRARDLDNMLKATLDVLQKSGVFTNDSQIDLLMIRRGELRDDGVVELAILRAPNWSNGGPADA